MCPPSNSTPCRIARPAAARLRSAPVAAGRACDSASPRPEAEPSIASHSRTLCRTTASAQCRLDKRLLLSLPVSLHHISSYTCIFLYYMYIPIFVHSCVCVCAFVCVCVCVCVCGCVLALQRRMHPHTGLFCSGCAASQTQLVRCVRRSWCVARRSWCVARHRRTRSAIQRQEGQRVLYSSWCCGRGVIDA